MFKKYQDKLYCFSPPVMLATFLIEFGLAAYAIWRYKTNKVHRLAIMILLALGTFQLAEYMTCGGLGWDHIEWVRLGYISITLLPALGIHIITTIANQKRPLLVLSAYASCLMFVLFYLFVKSAISDQACYANYAVFYTNGVMAQLFGVYYYGWMMIGGYLAWHWSHQSPSKRKALIAMVIGYATFIVPTTAFNIIDPATVHGIPSIMCGFAVFFAVILTFKVLPNSCKIRSKIK